jgi:hypothetical protein
VSRPREEFPRRATRDLRASMAEALAVFVRKAEFNAGGRRFRLKQVFDSWADWPDKQDWVGAAVLPDEAIKYGKTQRQPVLIEETWWPRGESGWGLYQICEATCDMQLMVRAPTDGERAAIVAALEVAFLAPGASGADVGGRSGGVLLPMPSYWGLSAFFSLIEARVLDDTESAARSRNEAMFLLRASAPQVKLDAVRPFLARVTQTSEGDPIP